MNFSETEWSSPPGVEEAINHLDCDFHGSGRKLFPEEILATKRRQMSASGVKNPHLNPTNRAQDMRQRTQNFTDALKRPSNVDYDKNHL